uniref:Ankyrin repeat domain 32 n=1 Tax=Iconisemion striatum TaxID=60296 RepID=A0A1A7WEM4_9TELE
MESCRHVFQVSGIKNREKKRILLKGINQLGGKYIGGSVYRHSSTHLIIPQVLPGEKFLAACAAGKWVVTPNYILDSVQNGSWLEERLYEVAIFTRSSAAFYPVRQWREKVSNGRITGAFQGWRVLLMVQEPTRRDMFKRLLKAGRAEVYNSPPPTFTSITHVMAKPVTESSKSQDAPCYPVSHIVQHLFGSNCVDIKFNITDDPVAEKDDYLDHDFSNLEAELKSVVLKKEGQPRLCFLQFLGYHDPHHPHSQAILADFSNVGTMIECGLFIEALDSIRSSAFPGLLPPATNLISLLQYAQQGNATSVFLRNFHQVLENLLLTNPPWLAPNSVKKYYAQVLQCPQCKTGLWPFLETAIRYCLSSGVTCHPLPGPALPTLVDFHYDIISFCLKLFQGELHSVTSRDFVRHQVTQAPSTFSSGSLLCGTFWTVWEHSTLLPRSVKQLIQLIVQAADMGGAETAKTQKLHLADTMLHLLSVLVEFWCQQHLRLNQRLVEKGLKDLSEHLAVVSQDLPPAVLVELVASVRSSRLKQTDEKGRTPMDLVCTPGQKEELLSSAEVGDSTQRHEGTEVLNLPLLEAGSSLLCHLVVSYQLERGLPGHSQPRDKPNSLVYKLVRALETHPLQKVTLDWTDQRAVKLVEDVETLLELSQGKHREQVSRAVRECKGESTTVLMEILENLSSRDEMLVADL